MKSSKEQVTHYHKHRKDKNYCKTITATFEKVKSIQYSKRFCLMERTLEKHTVFAVCVFHNLSAQMKIYAIFS